MGKHLTLYLNNIHLTKQLITVKKIKRKDIFTEDSNMKKFILISMIAVAAMGIIDCGEDDGSKADLRWYNDSNANLKDIVWTSSGKVDQTWEGVTNDDTATTYKGIDSLAGDGDCVLEDGNPATISLSAGDGVVTASSSSAVIQENAAATLNITGYTKK